MYAAAQTGKLPVYHRKIRGNHGIGEETGAEKGLKYLLERGSGQEGMYEKEQKEHLVWGEILPALLGSEYRVIPS